MSKETLSLATGLTTNMIAKGKEGFYEKMGFLRRPHDWEGAGMEIEMKIDL